VLGRRERHDLQLQLAAAQQRIKELEQSVRHGKEIDELTGLPSLRRFRAQVEIELQRARRHGRALTLAVLDVDGFRALNERHGFAAGDKVLAAVGEVLLFDIRAHDVACRVSADEFAILMPETDLTGAQNGMERLLIDLEEKSAGPLTSISASVGIAVFSREQSAPQLVAAAGLAMESARAAGGGRVLSDPAGGEPKDLRLRDAVSALAVTLLERDRYTGDHSEAVVELAGSVARGLGLDEEEIGRVQAAAQLHDIGKVAIPDEILNKPGKLTDEEFELMKDHTVIGERILRAIPGMAGVAKIVRHEHERWDGRGYPDGIGGETIPIGSRIILACDAYHAMISDRPYRKGMPHSQAMEELVRCAGSQFDPEVIEVLVGALYGMRQSGAPAPS
jgi:diguanylate cyclase (GGDEF)-like protein/putative nucleotidyltransferase with HDIG domain